MVHCFCDGTAAQQGKKVLVTAHNTSILDRWLKTFLTSQGMMNAETYEEGPGRIFSCVQDLERGGRLSIVPGLSRYLKKAYRDDAGFASGPGPAIAQAIGKYEGGSNIYLWQHGLNGRYWGLAGNEGIGGVNVSVIDNESIYPGLEFSNLWVVFRMTSSFPASIYCSSAHNAKVGIEAFNSLLVKHLWGYGLFPNDH